jgi:hypothetical protein
VRSSGIGSPRHHQWADGEAPEDGREDGKVPHGVVAWHREKDGETDSGEQAEADDEEPTGPATIGQGRGDYGPDESDRIWGHSV